MPVKPLVWSEPRPPTKEFPASHYDNVYADTPFGRIMIEWKGWKERDTRVVQFPWEELVGNLWLGCQAVAHTLDEAKQKAQEDFAKRVNECLQGD